jgi:nickel-dependent lactate racemase
MEKIMINKTYIAEGGAKKEIDFARTKSLLIKLAAQLEPLPPKVLIVPPDFTRFHSGAGEITEMLYRLLKDRCTVRILPALGTHTPVPAGQRKTMFGSIPASCFRVHDWRQGLRNLGAVPAAFIKKVSRGKLGYSIKVEINREITDGGYGLILSVGQIVPHEVAGIANHTKNILVGTGGRDTINKTHFLGAVMDMEKIMGRYQNPVRAVFTFAEEHFLARLPVVYVLTVRGRGSRGSMVTRGLYAGRGMDCYEQAAKLSQQVNLTLVPKPLPKVVVYLEPGEFKSTWLGNKAVYRTRMVIADRGGLLVLAPGLKEFGDAPEIDRLIRKYGYGGTPDVLRAVRKNPDLQRNLSAAAHLIHGSSEGRFTITYAPGHLSRKEIEGVNFQYTDLKTALARYNPKKLKDGWNRMPDGEKIYYISNPAVGLWALKEHF